MIKKFFTVMLGSLAAIWITFFLLVLGGIVTLAVVGAKGLASSSSVKVEKHSILYIALSGTITDRYQEGDLLTELREADTEKTSLAEILQAVRLAADDKKIDGIYLDCYGAEMGTASRQELIEALREFKQKSNKWIKAYGDNMAQGDYFIATAADSIFINPQGNLDIHGLGSQMMFFKGLLDKLDVQMQIFRVGRFKSAVEPYMVTEASEASKLQTQTYVDGIWQVVCNQMADNRTTLTPEFINRMADTLIMTYPSSTYVKAGLVDKLSYRHGVVDGMKHACGLDSDQDLRLVTPYEYLQAKGEQGYDAGKDHIALLYALGDINDYGNEGITADQLVPEILSLAEDDNVVGLVMRVNSPGGSAFASEQIWEALEMFKKTGKPFYVSMGDVAASGGYYISCGADKIYADASTLTGSIGIFGMMPNLNGLLSNKLGITFTNVQSTPNGVFPSTFTPMSAQQLERMQAYVERGYETFVGRCAEGRHTTVDAIKAIAEGRVWYGEDALRLGLVDELGSLNKALKDMARELNLRDDAYVAYPEIQNDPLLALLRMSRSAALLQGLEPTDSQEAMQQYLNLVTTLTSMAPVQARMEPVEIR